MRSQSTTLTARSAGWILSSTRRLWRRKRSECVALSAVFVLFVLSVMPVVYVLSILPNQSIPSPLTRSDCSQGRCFHVSPFRFPQFLFIRFGKVTMVEIMWLGQACFYIRCNGTSIVLDPYFQQEKVACSRSGVRNSAPTRSPSACTRLTGCWCPMRTTTTSTTPSL